MQVITADHYRPLHLHFLDDTGQNTSSDGNISGKWTLLVNVRPINGLTGSLKTQSHITDAPQLLLLGTLTVVVEERLLLKSFLCLVRQ